MPECHGEILEIFSGIQGEGLSVGVRQIFVRFAGCNLDCAYCDTMAGFDGVRQCLAEQTPGRRDFETLPWPLSVDTCVEAVRRLTGHSFAHHSLSLTGGEPLLQANFIREMLKALNRSMPVFLETNGTLPDNLEQLLEFIDILSIDIKLIEGDDEIPHRETHRRFLELSADRDMFVKLVVTSKVTLQQMETVCRLVQEVDWTIPLVLQPVTGRGAVEGPSSEQLLEMNAVCLSILPYVRVIPQTHIMIDQR